MVSLKKVDKKLETASSQCVTQICIEYTENVMILALDRKDTMQFW
jgi:hypothetical protein